MPPLPRSLRLWCLLLLPLIALASCRTVSFYTQAARGQWEISHKARPIAAILQSADTDTKLRKKLELVQDLRAFAASDLHLPAEEQYDCYCDLGRKFVVWVVFAAPEFSVEGKTWWYPLVGSLKYRGYFSQAEAEKEAAALTKKGYDVFAGGVDAYSTLGWFRDPVLNTFLRRDEAELAELLFHELTHQRLYISGDTDFNEAFATAVGQEGARRWLRARGRTAELKEYEVNHGLEREFIQLVQQTRGRLERLFAEPGRSPDAMRALKQAEFARLRREADALKKKTGASLPIDRWFSKPVNNARLNTLATYYDLVPAFEALIKRENGDLERVFNRIDAMKSMTNAARKEALMRN
jgi:predicted aminopeptidase